MASTADRRFDEVVSGTQTDHDCSPDLFGKGSFRGVQVSAPSRVLFAPRRPGERGPFARVMVCGACRLDLARVESIGAGHVLLVAVDASTHEAHAGPMTGLVTPEPGPLRPPASRPGSGVSIRYFNANLAAMLPLPEREADYFAYAVLGEYVSNVVHIAVRREDRDGGAR